MAGREVNTVNEGMEGGETIGVAVMLAHQSRRRLSAFSTTTPRINPSLAALAHERRHRQYYPRDVLGANRSAIRERSLMNVACLINLAGCPGACSQAIKIAPHLVEQTAKSILVG